MRNALHGCPRKNTTGDVGLIPSTFWEAPMSDDLIERLRAMYPRYFGDTLGDEAADHIDKLEAENKRTREILDLIPADRMDRWHTVTISVDGWHMAHPIFCDLAECPFDGLAQAEWVDPPTAAGVWKWHNFDDEPWEWEATDE